MLEEKFKFGNAFQPSEKDKAKNEELRKQFKFRTWVPESVIVVGDSYVFYNKSEDLKDFGMGLYEHVKSVFNNPGYTKMNPYNFSWNGMSLEELCKQYWVYQRQGLQTNADELLNYVKENFKDMR